MDLQKRAGTTVRPRQAAAYKPEFQSNPAVLHLGRRYASPASRINKELVKETRSRRCEGYSQSRIQGK